MRVHSTEREPAPSSRGPRDPVCGLRLNPRYLEYHTVWQGRDYYFCSLSCKMLFDQDPLPYLHDPNPSEPGSP